MDPELCERHSRDLAATLLEDLVTNTSSFTGFGSVLRSFVFSTATCDSSHGELEPPPHMAEVQDLEGDFIIGAVLLPPLAIPSSAECRLLTDCCSEQCSTII